MQTGNNDIAVRLLISSRLKIFRHLILLAFALSIAAGFIWYVQDEGQLVTLYKKWRGLSLYTFLFLGGCYLNIYILTPRLLLKNKWTTYFCSLLGLVLLTMISVHLIQAVLVKSTDKSSDDINYLAATVNLVSSSLSLFLFFAGTTTLTLFKYWIQDMQQSEELESTTLQLELKLLENQINPHFLFNMLNNANIMVDEDPDMASCILMKLDDLLRYQMNDSTRNKVYLSGDIVFLTDFLDLEKTRRDQFDYTISQEGNINNVEVSPLLFIPFVENAVKHNSDSEKLSYVNITFMMQDRKLTFICENSKPAKPHKKEDGGIGLINIKRRLDLLYGKNYVLKQKETETTYTVYLTLNL